MQLPNRSPDFNIIVNVWIYIGVRFNKIPNNGDELWTIQDDVWNAMPKKSNFKAAVGLE